jgi:hypothetical protein
MSPKHLLSSTENKLLLGLFLMICCVFYTHVANNLIESYNKQVESRQVEKQNLANYSQTSMFSCGYEVQPPFYVHFFWLQFFTHPISYFLLREKRISAFIVSALINSLMTFSVLAWNFRNYKLYLFNEVHWLDKHPYGYFGLSSHLPAFILAVLSLIFLILQLSIIVRFVVEKFQVKISLR